jgi:adenylate cyclase
MNANEAGIGPDDLTRAILGEDPRLTTDEVIAGSGLSADEARRLWRALGFPDVAGAPAFTSADRTALRRMSSAISDGRLDFETALQLTRAVAHNMSRLAEWQVATLSRFVELVERSADASGSRLLTAARLLETIEPPLEQLMLYAWRRHLAAAVLRVEALGAADADLHTVPLTVGFADLVSFTRLSAGVAETRLAELAEEFEAQCFDIIAAAGGRVVKTLGDSVLFAVTSAEAGLALGLDLIDEIGEVESLPDLHIGIATGPVAMRLGDVFGAPVNLASRLTAVARRNRVICDEATAAAVSSDPMFRTRKLTPRILRGVGQVTPIAVTRSSSSSVARVRKT